MTINYYYYPKFSDYEKRIKVPISKQTFSIHRLTLIKACISVGVGLMGHRNFDKSLLIWRMINVTTFVDSNFKIINIDKLETSEKVSGSFFLGMVFAHIHMQENYNVRFTKHLKSSNIKYKSKINDNKTPDLWGLDTKNNISYLIEAKGSLMRSSCIKRERINSAHDQLRAILEVHHCIDKQCTIYSKSHRPMKKFIVATHPDKNNNITQHVIDPEYVGEKIIKIDGNKTTYDQYINLVTLIEERESRKIEINKVKFRVIDLGIGNYSVGVMESIYDLFGDPLSYKELYMGVNKQLDILEDKIEDKRMNENYFVGLEGIIVVDTNYKSTFA